MIWKYKTNKEIQKLLQEIEGLRIAFDLSQPLPHIEANLKRRSILKSSVYSARIEGNTLNINDIGTERASKNRQNIEIFNLLSAYRFLENKNLPKKLSLSLIKKLHQITMNSLSPHSGSLRQEPWGIFNQAGVAVYLAPAYFNVPDLMDEYLKYLSNLKYSIPEIAGIAQFVFEKIHPFADGNGRVGRLISAYLMAKSGYGFRGLISIEESIDENKNAYYQALEPQNNATQFVTFFLSSFIFETKKILLELSQTKEELPEDSLLPRRREIYQTIKDHPDCSFDFIKRRFTSINEKTLHYDVKKLIDGNFILKLGISKGVAYKVKV